MMRIVPLKPRIEELFLKFLMRDVVSNFYALLDLKFSRERTKFWLAFEDDVIIGYLLEHDGRVINLRGEERCAADLLKMTSLEKPELNVEPAHILTAESLFEPIDAVGTSRDKFNVISSMCVDRRRFKPIIKHEVKKLGDGELSSLRGLFARFYHEMSLGPIMPEQISRIFDRAAQRGTTYGIHDGDELVSFASGNNALDGLANMAPVYTVPEFRRRGYATSACSALTRDLLSNNERIILFVSESNVAALKVYWKIGFVKTGHTFLTFRGQRNGPT